MYIISCYCIILRYKHNCHTMYSLRFKLVAADLSRFTCIYSRQIYLNIFVPKGVLDMHILYNIYSCKNLTILT
jgi:hypothetical protein